MTDREKAIVMAYTGKCMLTGDKLHIFYKYVEDIMGRPVYTHEMGIKAVDDAIREKSKADFITLCKEQEPKVGHWEWVQYDSNPNIGNWHCSECRRIVLHMPEELDNTPKYKWCPMCGAKMIEPTERSE